MSDVVVVALAGFAAAFVDGALGMGFGPTSSSILLSSGLSPATASATVNIAKAFTGVAGGISHWRVGNVDWRLVRRLAVPGLLGAAIGATVLSSVDGDSLRPLLAALLFVIGVRILVRFRNPIRRRSAGGRDASGADTPGVVVAGAVGGVTNGLIGAWGPVVTPYLLHRGVAPRYVVGSVNTAEVAVATVAAGSLLAARTTLELSTVVAMLGGGIVAAPIAAVTVRHIPARLLGVLVAGLLLLTNARELALWADVGTWRWVGYAAITVAVGACATPIRWRRAWAARRAGRLADVSPTSGSQRDFS